MAVIYQITNMVNGKFYIGSADSFARREWQHKYDLKRGAHKNPHMQASWNKYGADAFVFEVVEEIPLGESQLAWENKHLSLHAAKSNCYNINQNAELPRLGLKMTDESKALLSLNRTGKGAGEAHYRYGKTVSTEVREKIGAAQRGKKKASGRVISEEGMAKIRAAAAAGHYASFKGKTHTAETKGKMSRAIRAVLPDRTAQVFSGLSVMRDTLGVSIATIIRACNSGEPIKQGVCGGWVLSYADQAQNAAPHIPEEYAMLPRTRTAAKELGAPLYFTGIPCEHGHIAPRKVKGVCLECAKIEGQKANERKRIAKQQIK
jgi:group I intron endonuclease